MLNRSKGKLIIVEGIDGSGKSTQLSLLSQWLRSQTIAVAFSEWNSSPLVHETMRRGKKKKRLTPTTFSLLHATDFADRMENEIVPALRAGFVVLTDRYIFSIIARAIARDEDSQWIEQVTDFAVIPHAVYYLRIRVKDLVSWVIRGRGAFDYWESGMDMRFGSNMYDSFVRYQTRLMRTLDQLATQYGFVALDASKPADLIFVELQRQIATLGLPKVEARLPTNGVALPLDHPGPPTRQKRINPARQRKH
jgi:dTMP kinase